MPLAARHRDNLDVEAVRFGDDTLPCEEFALRAEGEAIDVAAKPREGDGELDILRVDRFAVPRCENAELRLGAILEDYDLDREIAILEQFATVRAFGIFLAFALSVAFAFFMLVFALGSATAGSERHSKEQRRSRGGKWKLLHGIFSARGAASKRPVRRSISASKSR